MLCNEVLATPDAGLAGNDHLELDLQPVPEQALDPEAMRSVVTNLVTNAREASHGEGVVKISTRFDRGKVAVVVADDGVLGVADDVFGGGRRNLFACERLGIKVEPRAVDGQPAVGRMCEGAKDAVERRFTGLPFTRSTSRKPSHPALAGNDTNATSESRIRKRKMSRL